jgi:hypothetical protein
MEVGIFSRGTGMKQYISLSPGKDNFLIKF